MSWFGSASEWKQGLTSAVLSKVEELENQNEKLKRERIQKQNQIDTFQQALDKQKRKIDEEVKQKQSLQKENESLGRTCEVLQDKLQRGTNNDSNTSVSGYSMTRSDSFCLGTDKNLKKRVEELENENKGLLDRLQESSRNQTWNHPLKDSSWNYFGGSASSAATGECLPQKSPFKTTMKKALETSEDNPFKAPVTPIKKGLEVSDENPFKTPLKYASTTSLPSLVIQTDDMFQLEKKLDDALKEIEDLKRQKNQLELNIQPPSSQESEVFLLKTELENAKANTSSQETALQQTADQMTSYRTKADALEIKVEDLEQKMKSLQTELECQRQNTETSKKHLEDKLKEKEREHIAEASRFQTEVGALELQVRDFKTKLSQQETLALSNQNALQGSLDKVTVQLSYTEKEKQLAQAECGRLESSVNQLQKSEEDFKKSVSHLKQDNDIIKSQVDTLKVKLNEAETQMKRLQTQLTFSEEQSIKCKNDLEDALIHHKALLDKEKESHKLALESVVSEKDMVIKNMESSAKKVELDIQHLKDSVLVVTKEKEETLQQLKAVEESCEQKLLGVNELEAKLLVIELSLKTKEAQLEEVKRISAEDIEKAKISANEEYKNMLESQESIKQELIQKHNEERKETGEELEVLHKKVLVLEKNLGDQQKIEEVLRGDKLTVELKLWEMEGKVDDLTQKISNLEDDLGDAKSKITKKEIEIETRTQKLQEANTTIASLVKTLEEAKFKVAHYDVMKENETKALKNTQNMSEVIERKDAMIKTLEDFNTTLQSSQKELLEKGETESVKYKEEIDSLLLNNSQMEKRLQENEEQFVILEKTNDTLSQSASLADDDVRRLDALNEDLKCQLGKNTTEKEELKSQLKNNTTEKEELKSQLEKRTTEKEELKSQLEGRTTEKEELKSQLEKRTTEKEELKCQLEGRTTEKEELKIQLEKRTTEKEKLKSQLEKNTTEKEELKSQLEKNTIEKEELEASNQLVLKEQEAMKQEANNWEHRFEESDRKLSQEILLSQEKKKECEEGKHLLEELKLAVKTIEEKRTQLVCRLSALESENGQLKGQIEEERQQEINRNNKLRSQEEVIHDLKEKLQEAEAKLAEMEKGSEELRQEFDSELKEMGEKLKTTQNEFRALKEKCLLIEKEKLDLFNKCEELVAKLRQEEETNKCLSLEFDCYKEIADLMKRENGGPANTKEIYEKNDHLEKKVQELKETIAKQTRKILELQKRNSETQQEREQLRQEMQEMKKRHSELEGGSQLDIRALQDEINAKTKELIDMNKKMETLQSEKKDLAQHHQRVKSQLEELLRVDQDLDMNTSLNASFMLDSLKDEMSQTKLDLKRLKEEKELSSSWAQELDEKVESLQNDLNQRVAAEKELKKEISSLQETNSGYQNEVKSLKLEYDRLCEERQNLREETDKLKIENKEIQDKKSQKERDLTELTQDLIYANGQLEARNNDLVKEKEDLVNKNETVLCQNNFFESEIQSLTEELQEKNLTLDDLESERQASVTANQGLLKENVELIKLKSDLKDKLKLKEEEERKLKEELSSDICHRLNALEGRLSNQTKEGEVDVTSQAKSDIIETKEEQPKEMKHIITILRTRISAIEASQYEVEDRIMSMKKELEERKATISQIKEEKQTKDVEIVSLRKCLLEGQDEKKEFQLMTETSTREKGELEEIIKTNKITNAEIQLRLEESVNSNKELQKELETYLSENNIAKSDCKAMKTKITELTSTLDKLEVEKKCITEKCEELTSLTDTVEELRSNFVHLQDSYDARSIIMEQLEREKERQVTEIKELKETLTKNEKDLSNLEIKFSSQEKVEKELRNRIEEYQELGRRTKEELKTLEESNRDSSDHLRTLENSLKNLECEKRDLTTEKNQVIEENVSLNMLKTELLMKIENFEKDKERKEASARNAKEEFEKLNQKLISGERAKENLELALNEIKKENTVLKEVTAEKEDKILALESQKLDSDELNKNLINLMNEIDDLKKCINTHTEEKTSLVLEKTSVTEQLSQSTQEQETLHLELREKNEMVMELMMNSRAKESEVKRLLKEHKIVEESLTQSKTELEKLGDILKHKDHELERLGEILNHKEHELERLGEILKHKEHELERQEEILKHKEHELERLGEVLKHKEHELERLGEVLKNKEHELEIERQNLATKDSEMTDVKTKMELTEKTVRDLEKQMFNKDLKLDEFRKNISKYKEDLNTLKARFCLTEKTLALKEKELARGNQLIDKLREEKKKLMYKLTQNSVELKQKEAVANESKVELKQLQEQYNAKLCDYDKQVEICNELNTKNTDLEKSIENLREKMIKFQIQNKKLQTELSKTNIGKKTLLKGSSQKSLTDHSADMVDLSQTQEKDLKFNLTSKSIVRRASSIHSGQKKNSKRRSLKSVLMKHGEPVLKTSNAYSQFKDIVESAKELALAQNTPKKRLTRASLSGSKCSQESRKRSPSSSGEQVKKRKLTSLEGLHKTRKGLNDIPAGQESPGIITRSTTPLKRKEKEDDDGNRGPLKLLDINNGDKRVPSSPKDSQEETEDPSPQVTQGEGVPGVHRLNVMSRSVSTNQRTSILRGRRSTKATRRDECQYQ